MTGSPTSHVIEVQMVLNIRIAQVLVFFLNTNHYGNLSLFSFDKLKLLKDGLMSLVSVSKSSN